MDRGGIRVSRRTVLAGLGASVIDTAFAEGGPDVQGTEDGGFAVFANFREEWRVDGADIKRSWGSAATATVNSAGSSPSVVISGALFEKKARLEITFRPHSVGWECRCCINLQNLGEFEASVPFPFAGSPKAPAFSIPIRVAHWRQTVGLPSGTAMLRPRFEIARQTLAPTISGPFVFDGLGGLRAQQSLQLLADIEAGSTLSRLTFGSSERLNLAEGWSIDAEGMRASFPVREPNYLVIEGEGILQIGRTRFVADRKSSIRYIRHGPQGLVVGPRLVST